VQHSEEPALIAALDGRGPRIGACGGWMSLQIEYMNYPIPDDLAGELLVDRDRVGEKSGAAMLASTA